MTRRSARFVPVLIATVMGASVAGLHFPPGFVDPAPVLGSRAPLHDAAVAWVADARTRLRSGALLAIDYCRPTTGWNRNVISPAATGTRR